MSRDFKFRAWIEDEERMQHWDGIFHMPDPSYKTMSKIMQYTGLEDCSGQEIYEGDIVNAQTFAPNMDESITVKGKIEWLYDAFYFTAINNPTEFSDFLGYWIGDDLEVVGNIFENQELLSPAAIDDN